MKLTLDVSSIQYNQKPQTALYDPKKTSTTGAENLGKWTITTSATSATAKEIEGLFGKTQKTHENQ